MFDEPVVKAILNALQIAGAVCVIRFKGKEASSRNKQFLLLDSKGMDHNQFALDYINSVKNGNTLSRSGQDGPSQSRTLERFCLSATGNSLGLPSNRDSVSPVGTARRHPD